MPEFESKEEYEGWKDQKMTKVLSGKASTENSKLLKFVFLGFSSIAFLSIFDNFVYIGDRAISIWYGHGVFKGLSLCTGILIVGMLILTGVSLYTDKIKHIRITVRALSLVNVLILILLITVQFYASKKELSDDLVSREQQVTAFQKQGTEFQKIREQLNSLLSSGYYDDNSRMSQMFELIKKIGETDQAIEDAAAAELIAKEEVNKAKEAINRGVSIKVSIGGILFIISQLALIISTFLKRK